MAELFTPFTLRDISFKNRIAVSPMSQYRAKDGHANSWHAVHLAALPWAVRTFVFAARF